MRRRIALPIAALLLMSFCQSPQTAARSPQEDKGDQKKEARAQLYASQAALFSALAHAQALERITEGRTPDDYSLARTLISTANRSIQGVSSGSVAMGQARHDLEKNEHMITLRRELFEATKATDEAHTAADGHGTIGPHAKNMAAHLLQAMTALVQLAEDIGIDALPSPGANAIENARSD